jgi:RNA-splicing ligase RtcB
LGNKIDDKFAASKTGIEERGQVCIMIHSGSRGFGHQVATDALVEMEKAMKRDKIVDYQLTRQPVLVGGTMGTCSYVLTGTLE